MKVDKRIHNGWTELEEVGNIIPHIFGKYQYIYSSDKGKISLVELKNYYRDGKDLWEIYSLEGELFEDVDRFSSKEEAEVEIKKLLD